MNKTNVKKRLKRPEAV